MHNEMFGLFEAMSAIEMMDPKMDAGMCCNKNTEPPLTFDTAVSVSIVEHTDTSRCNILIVLFSISDKSTETVEFREEWTNRDHGWCVLVSGVLAWRPFIGTDIVHLFVSSSTISNWRQILESVLLCYSQTCTDHSEVHPLVSSGTKNSFLEFFFQFQNISSAVVYEEEDFEIRDYEYTLEPDMSNSKSCFMLKEAEDDLTKKIKSGQDTSEEIHAIVNRLKFLRLVLQALVAIWPDKNLSPTQIEMVEIQKLLSGAVDVMPGIKKTISLGTQPNG